MWEQCKQFCRGERDNRKIFSIMLVGLLLCVARTALSQTLTVGILVQENSGEVTEWQPTLDYLAQALPGLSFQARPLGFGELVSDLRKRAVDCAILDPAALVNVAGFEGAQMLAQARYRFHGDEFSGCAGALVVSQARADLRLWSDLRNAEVVAVNTDTLSGWRAVQREFFGASVQVKVRKVASYEAALAEVMAGRADAAALPAGVLEQLDTQGVVSASLFHVVGPPSFKGGQGALGPVARSTRLYPGWGFAASPELPSELRRKIAAALLAMPEPASESADSLRAVAWEPYPSDAPVHAAFRALRLPTYDRDGENSLKQVVRRYAYIFIAAGMVAVVGLGIIITLSGLNRALRVEVLRRREAEKALLKSIERFEQIAAISSDWIWECDEKGVFTYVNANTVPMLGYAVHEVLGRRYDDLLSALERERLAQEGRNLLDGSRRVFREQVRMRTKDGRIVVHEITAEPVRDGTGKLVGFRGVNRDITDRVHAVRLMV